MTNIIVVMWEGEPKIFHSPDLKELMKGILGGWYEMFSEEEEQEEALESFSEDSSTENFERLMNALGLEVYFKLNVE